jgi:hypothetical protein
LLIPPSPSKKKFRPHFADRDHDRDEAMVAPHIAGEVRIKIAVAVAPRAMVYSARAPSLSLDAIGRTNWNDAPSLPVEDAVILPP